MYSSVLLVCLLPLVAFASLHDPVARRSRHRKSTSMVKRDTSYTLQDWYQGEDFLNDWTFFDQADPTHGLVEYVDKATAQADNLAYVQDDNTTVLAVDSTSWVASGSNRKSVRITSSKTYSSGLFIADIYAMPHGCSLWPAYWSVGPNWPEGGEIDVIEGANEQTTNQMTLHTSAGCTLDSALTSLFTSKVADTTCQSGASDNDGCAFLATATNTYGHGFNLQAGGVFAHLIADAGISIWFFSRDDIPDDISSQNPDPLGWGTPSAFWSSKSCDISSHFYDHSLVFDITLCGDWAGAAFASSGCSGTCADTVADPSNFVDAKWEINYVAVYQ